MEKTIGQLADAGISVEQTGDDAYIVKSNKTGSVVKRNANAKDLNDFLRCAEYIKGSAGRVFHAGFRQTRHRHPAKI